MRQPARRGAGFSLVELMVTIAVLAILLAIGIPSFASLIAANRLTSATNELVASLQTARTEAIRRNARITVCPAAPTATACSGTAWRDGWMVFVDQTPGNTPAPENTTDILFRGGPSPQNITIVGNTPVSSYVSFTADGTSKLLSRAFQAGTLRVCSTATALGDDRRARHLVLTGAGRIVLKHPPTGVPSTCPSP